WRRYGARCHSAASEFHPLPACLASLHRPALSHVRPIRAPKRSPQRPSPESWRLSFLFTIVIQHPILSTGNDVAGSNPNRVCEFQRSRSKKTAGNSLCVLVTAAARKAFRGLVSVGARPCTEAHREAIDAGRDAIVRSPVYSCS